jgi:succinoglycan biosynthesis protein ExoM
MKIDLCICTFRRSFISETLASVARARVPPGADLRIIVIDNDDTPTARDRVLAAAATMPHPVSYAHASGANISIARNAALALADGDWIAFLDDDEIADPDWLLALVARQRETGTDAVFGQSRATYGSGAPAWIVRGDFHSQCVTPRGGVVQTGHTCNALLRWGNAPWRTERFDLGRGRAGGEDTEFFFRLRRMGARYAIADASIVREDVPPDRQHLSWLLHRRYRIGQSYAASATTLPQRGALLLLAAAKSAYCLVRAAIAAAGPERRAFWLMRGAMHAGVCAGCLNLRQPILYGDRT